MVGESSARGGITNVQCSQAQGDGRVDKAWESYATFIRMKQNSSVQTATCANLDLYRALLLHNETVSLKIHKLISMSSELESSAGTSL